MPKWRNGRRARFRSVFPYGSGGSTPLFGTTDEKVAIRFLKILRELATAYLGKTVGVWLRYKPSTKLESNGAEIILLQTEQVLKA